MQGGDTAQVRPETGYGYISRMYGITYRPGMRVQLERSDRIGTVAHMKPSAGHRVQVRFDGERHASPCHPNSLTILQESHP